MIRHITSIDNIRNGKVYDPTLVKHGVITANRISDLSWWIDPATHLNLDLPAHLMNLVFVATRLEKGARILVDGDHSFAVASVDSGAYRRYGKVEIPEMRRRITLRPIVHV
jgi:hypothetical protein